MTEKMTIEDLDAFLIDYLDTDKADAERKQREKEMADLIAMSEQSTLRLRKAEEAFKQRNLQKLAQIERNKKPVSLKITSGISIKQK